MKKKLISALAAAVLALGAGEAAHAAGLYTNGLPTITPNGSYPQLKESATFGADTNLPSGQSPQTISVTAFQIAASQAELIKNQATSTAAAATLNTKGGLITTEALTTAPGGTYVFTLTDSTILATTKLQVAGYSASNTGGMFAPTSVVVTPGQAVITFTNVGTTALNGTMLVAFHV